MKNTLHSPLFYLFKFDLKLITKSIFLLTLFTFLLASNSASAQLPVTYDFESGIQGWTNNGNDSGRFNNPAWACNGNGSIYSKDDDGTRNIITSPTFNLTSYSSLTISFCHKSVNLENGEGFRLQFFDGSSWVTIRTYSRNTDWITEGSGVTHSFSETITDASYTFASNSRFRFRGTAGRNNEWNFFDDILITGVNTSPCTQPTNQPTSLTFSSITDTSLDLNFTAATSSPDAYLVIYNTSGTTPTITDGTTYTIGSTFSGNTVLSNNGDTSFSLTGLTSDTTYYFYVYSFNSNCVGGPDYLNTSPLTGNETTLKYCIPVGTDSSYYIDDFSTSGGVTNITNNGSGYSTNGYGNYTGLSASQYRGADLNFSSDFEDPSFFDGFGFGIWVDFNDDGDFDDAGESLYNNGYVDPVNDSFTIPLATAPGSYQMRILADWNDPSPSACNNSFEGEAEDYILIVLEIPPCVEPTNQPTDLVYNSITETSMNISFTPATGSPDGYLIVYNTTGTTPTITDGTTYTIGSTFSGNTVVSNNSDTAFTVTGLTENTTYYFYVFSFDSNCTGAPDYLTTIPLTDNIKTEEICSPTTALGSTTLSCPSVDAGGLGLSGADPAPINCSVGSNTSTLEASFLNLGDTSTYSVESIPYAPPYQFNCLANPVSVNDDDVWSTEISLPFDFCFYGITYSSCVIGSNGVISFDTSLASTPSVPEPTGWRTLFDLPNAENARDYENSTTNIYDFGPSIYGVHHDVDPSVGGEIGYQLITLDTGCRALVAAWSDVPMYDDNSLLYTGMIVFYEDTNVIEVYIKEKRALDTWNNGNATVGLQGDSATAVVAPNRNTTDPNWTAYDEAWRFLPAGSSITTLKWYENSISAANEIIDPNNDGEITVTPTSTTTYFSEVTYNLCSGSTIVEVDSATITLTGDKVWDGSESSDWNDADNWTPAGVPIITDCILIPVTPNDPIMSGSTDGTGYNLEIEDGASLIQQSNATLTIDDAIVIEPNGDLEVRDSASIIQITDVDTNKNDGAAKVQRRVAGIGNYDYVYWSSPVDIFDVEDISPGTPSYAIYKWTPTMANGTAGQHGNWVSTSEDMDVGKGYIVRGLTGNTIASTAEFNGKLNNGKISYPISRGTYTGANYAGIGNTSTAEDDNWNLLGNPYPSALSLKDFVLANPAIDGTLYFWQHLTPLDSGNDDPFYEGFAYNYSPNDYLAANDLGSTPPGFNGFIASGQGFFALMLDSAPTTSNVSYNNTMRGTYANDGFFRSASTTEDKHRIWLDLVNEDNIALSTLVGFANGATNDIDRLYDGFLMNQTGTQFYSIASEQRLTIQGRALPFIDTETIPLGYKASSAGNYTISINQVDGLFDNADQGIYLEDTELNIIHDLRANPYGFTTELGTFDDRFILRFTNQSLSIKDQEAISNLNIRTLNNTIDARSKTSSIKSFELYDITGRLIHKNLNVENTNYNYQTDSLSTGTYIVTVSLTNGVTVSKKLII